MKHSVTISYLVATLLFSYSSQSFAQQADEERYGKCLDMAERAPDRAINMALVWQGEAGGVPARHCEAIGLFHLGEYSEAAIRFEKIAEDMRIGKDMPVRQEKRIVANKTLLAEMYGQAANAWLLADELVRAEAAVNTAMSLAEQNTQQMVDLMLDKAQIAAADGYFHVSLELVEKVMIMDKGRKDILLYAASSARGSEDYIKAQFYLDQFQDIFPDNITGYLERGNLEDALGHPGLARKSWIKVIELAPESVDAEAARANMERLDLPQNKP